MCDCIPRIQMPQVEYTDYPALITWLAKQGVQCETRTYQPRELRGRQKVDHGHVRSVMQSAEEMSRPALTSSDNLIVDGNHRWMAHVIDHSPVPALCIELPFEECVRVVLSFPQTQRYA